jgi:hypothetical protein
MSEFEFAGNKNPKVVSAVDPDQVLKFYLSKKDLSDYEVFCRFIDGIKAMVRKDPRYTNYKSVLFGLGLNRCQVFSEITDEMAPIEMHHGPIFTLFDIISIVVDHTLEEEKHINSFLIADLVLKEHEKHNIQIVMLCETAHEGAENGSTFLSFKQGFGFLDRFIKNYKKGIRREHYDMLKQYLKLSKENNATDNGIFEIIDRVKKYVKP